MQEARLLKEQASEKGHTCDHQWQWLDEINENVSRQKHQTCTCIDECVKVQGAYHLEGATYN